MSAAIISPCGTYRYRLSRVWDAALPPAVFVMLNPSTASAERDDPTIRKCIEFSRRLGCGHLVVVNLFALRSTDPKALRRHRDPVGPDNDAHIRTAVLTPDAVIVPAWGAVGGPLAYRLLLCRRISEVGGIMAARNVTPRPLALTKYGDPRHPLYVPYSAIEKAKP